MEQPHAVTRTLIHHRHPGKRPRGQEASPKAKDERPTDARQRITAPTPESSRPLPREGHAGKLGGLTGAPFRIPMPSADALEASIFYRRPHPAAGSANSAVSSPSPPSGSAASLRAFYASAPPCRSPTRRRFFHAGQRRAGLASAPAIVRKIGSSRSAAGGEARSLSVVPSARVPQMTMNRDRIRDVAARLKLKLPTSSYRYAKRWRRCGRCVARKTCGIPRSFTIAPYGV